MNRWIRLEHAMRTRGPRGVAHSAWAVVEDRLWGWWHGVDTDGEFGVDDLTTIGEHRGDAGGYGTLHVGNLRAIFARIPALPERHLVDFGSGLGRVLFAAHLEGFAHATGVEFSAELVGRARHNLARFRRVGDRPVRVSLVHCDAARYRITADQDVFYFYNPFGPVVIEKVLANIEASVSCCPRDVWLVYVNPVHLELFELRPGYSVVERLVWSGLRSVILRYNPPSRDVSAGAESAGQGLGAPGPGQRR